MADHIYIVAYDVTDAKRLRKVLRVMKGQGEHVQFSVFRCMLTERAREDLVSTLDRIIDHKTDQVLFVDLGPADGRASMCISSLGAPYDPEERKALIL